MIKVNNNGIKILYSTRFQESSHIPKNQINSAQLNIIRAALRVTSKS